MLQENLDTQRKGKEGESSESLGYVPGQEPLLQGHRSRPQVKGAEVVSLYASVSNPAISGAMSTPTPPTLPAPPIPTEVSPPVRENASVSPKRGSPTRFSTVRSEVRSGAIRIDITNPQQWAAGDVAVIRNQEAKEGAGYRKFDL